MEEKHKTIALKGRVFLKFDLVAVTGLHIGGSDTGIEIGGVDKTVIRDPRTNRPYIPGSSLKGKMRSLLEKYKGLLQNRRIGRAFMHICEKKDVYDKCAVCKVFGVPGELDFATPTRLVVRDVHLTAKCAKELEDIARTDLPYTEVKTEVAIDRVTSQANPRQMERVPAGSVFGPAELVYSIYGGDVCDEKSDVANLRVVVEALQLLEDDYLGGLGSRGSGKVQLQNIKVSMRGHKNYLAPPEILDDAKEVYKNLDELIDALDTVCEKVQGKLEKT